MTHEEKIARWIGSGKLGTEIGPGNSPLPGLDPPPIYVDCFPAFGHVACVADYYGHARALPFHDHSLDYVLASHVLEHVANPVAALAEWYRVVRPGGIIYLVVPDRRATWDRGRPLTSVDHLLADYRAGTTAVDATHIDEFVHEMIWSEWSADPAGDAAEQKQAMARTLHAAVANGEEINIHFHTFEPSNLRALLETLSAGAVPTPGKAKLPRLPFAPPGDGANIPPRPPLPRFAWEIVDFAEGFPAASPNGVLAVLRVAKNWRARAEAAAFQLRTRGDPRAVVREDAVPFAEWAANPGRFAGRYRL